MAAAHEAYAARVKEPARTVDGLEKVLGGDGRVVTAMFLDLAFEKALVGVVLGHNLLRRHHKDALDAVGVLLRLQFPLFGPQKVGGELDGADIDGRGVIRGAHRSKDGFQVRPDLILRLVHHQQPVRGMASRRGLGVGR